MKTFNTCQTCGKPKPDDVTEECAHCSGTAFARWMNRPLRRVQVYTWRLANKLFGDEPITLFRARRRYRDEVAKRTRLNIAAELRRMRGLKSITLPTYNEATSEYIYEKSKL